MKFPMRPIYGMVLMGLCLQAGEFYLVSPIVGGEKPEWSQAVSIPVTQYRGVDGNPWTGGGTDDLYVTARMLYDKNFLYLNVSVKDDKTYQPYSRENLWMGDSVQVGFDTLRNARPGEIYNGDDYEYGFGLVAGRPVTVLLNRRPLSALPKVAISRKEKNTEYEIAFPWNSLAPLQPEAGSRFGISILVNDNDGRGRKGYLQWTDGIGTGKEPAKFATAELARHPRSALLTTALYPRQNFYRNNQDLFLASRLWLKVPATLRQTFTVEANGKILEKRQKAVKFQPGETPVLESWNTAALPAGEYRLRFRVEGDNLCLGETATVVNLITREEIAARLNAVKQSYCKLKKLLNELQSRNLESAPEKVTATVGKLTIPLIEKYIAEEKYLMAQHLLVCLEEGVAEELISCGDLLSGKKKGPRCPKFVNTEIRVKDGVLSRDGQPQLLFGIMGDYNVIKSLLDPAHVSDLSDLGFSLTEFCNAGPQATFPRPDTRPVPALIWGWGPGDKWKGYSTEEAFRLAHAGNLAGSLLLSIHQFPEWFYKKYPDAVNCGQNDKPGNFHKALPCMANPVARKLYEKWLRLSIQEARNIPALFAYDMANELTFFSVNKSCRYCRSAYQEWLKKKYTSLEAVNQQYGTRYDSFDAVMPPEQNNSPAWIDYDLFLNNKVEDFFLWMRGIIKAEDPGKPVFIEKYGPSAIERQALNWNPDWEILGETEDICGVDAVTEWKNSYGTDLYSLNWQGQTLIYDLMKSWHPDKPIINTEYHFGDQRAWQKTHPEKMPPGYARATCWSGVIHGLSAGIAWIYREVWDAGDDFTRQFNFLSTPDMLREYGKTSLELRRLSSYLTPFAAEKGQYHILYSHSSIHDEKYRDSLKTLHEALYFEGMPVRFVSERQIQRGELAGKRLVIVPEHTRLTAAAWQKLAAWQKRGGKLIAFGRNPLRQDEYGRLRHAKIPTVTLPGNRNAAECRTALKSILQEAGIKPLLKLEPAVPNGDCEGIEYRVTAQHGNYLVYMMNLSHAEKTVRLNGMSSRKITNLVTGQQVLVNEFQLQPLVPFLLTIQ